METGNSTSHIRGGKHRYLPQDAAQLSQMVQNLRWSPLHRASGYGAHRCVRSSHSWFSIPSWHSRQLSGNGTAHQGRVAEDEGSSKGNGRFRYQRRGIVYKASGFIFRLVAQKIVECSFLTVVIESAASSPEKISTTLHKKSGR